ncbi:AbrB family transcriptional regulator [Pseudomonas syringae]|uniref:AbrB family transcriptional regulator n=1 Tax=Pseudomonas syringae TaxID=317 RepID=UPI00215B6C40|nr:AbrB family transcriptional regulator [Pseudomonas syringae]MCR8718348.1 AbrB family transcriptional regulator [Pseudomonas syringae]
MAQIGQHWLATLVVGGLGGWGANLIGWPLPWVVGSLVMVMAVRCCGLLLPGIPGGRKVGQLIVAIVIGCHFTLEVMREVVSNLGIVVMAIALTLVIALSSIWLLHRWGVELSTAFFALMPANSTEMIHLSRKRGADSGFVAAAHSVRLLTILLGVPLGATLLASHDIQVTEQPVLWGWLIGICPLAWVFALLFERLNLPNPWIFGPFMACAIMIGGADLHMSMPGWLGAFGQLMAGCVLGINFDRPFFRRAPAFVGKVFLLFVGAVVATAAVAWVVGPIAQVSGLSLALGMMPGNAPEMSLTAGALNLAVALVTAMQTIRMILVQAATLPLYKLFTRSQAQRTSEKRVDQN